MTTLRTRIAVPLAIAASLVVLPALTGCTGIINGIVNQASGGQVDLGGQSVPASFPSEIPLISGEIIYGLAITPDDGADGWSVIVKVDGVGAIDTITAQMEAAGFVKNETIGGTTDEGATAAFESANYNVLVAIANDSTSGSVATYTVAEKDE
jgi:hypothetical protein